jgi:hypothetical protein
MSYGIEVSITKLNFYCKRRKLDTLDNLLYMIIHFTKPHTELENYAEKDFVSEKYHP